MRDTLADDDTATPPLTLERTENNTPSVVMTSTAVALSAGLRRERTGAEDDRLGDGDCRGVFDTLSSGESEALVKGDEVFEVLGGSELDSVRAGVVDRVRVSDDVTDARIGDPETV